MAAAGVRPLHTATIFAALSLALAGCGGINSAVDFVSGVGGGKPAEGQPGYITGFLGGVVADEPQAALLGRQVLSAGGNAADAAAAVGLALAVTLPSRASLGAGGACLAYTAAGAQRPQAVMFTSIPPAASAGSNRPAAVPMLARGMFALKSWFGHLPFETIIQPVEQMARGVRASHAFASDLAVVAGPLVSDPAAAAVFFRGGRQVVEGDVMVQPDLAATMAEMRTAGVGDLYLGGLARRLVAGAPQAGAAFNLTELRNAVPKLEGALSTDARNGDRVTFLPPPADGGLAAAAAFQVLDANPADAAGANARGLAVASRWRQGGTDVTVLSTATNLPPPNLPPLPASTTFGTLDRNGNAVVCAVTMGNLFGTGRVLPGMGIVLAASPNWLPPPLLSAAMAYNADKSAFRALAGGSGQAGAPLAAAMMISQALGQTGRVAQPAPGSVPDPGRANVIACSRYLPGREESCAFATDPRGSGLATGGGG